MNSGGFRGRPHTVGRPANLAYVSLTWVREFPWRATRSRAKPTAQVAYNDAAVVIDPHLLVLCYHLTRRHAVGRHHHPDHQLGGALLESKLLRITPLRGLLSCSITGIFGWESKS